MTKAQTTSNPFQDSFKQRCAELTQGRMADYIQRWPLAAVLPPLLMSHGWQGSSRQLTENLPEIEDSFDLTALRNVLARLGFKTRWHRKTQRIPKPGHWPGVFFSHQDRQPFIVLEQRQQSVLLVPLETQTLESHPEKQLQGQWLELEPQEENEAHTENTWLGQRLTNLSHLWWLIGGLTLLTNLLALSVPFYVMTVYDRVISTQSTQTLLYLLIGVVIAQVIDFAIRHLRSRSLNYASARLHFLMGSNVFARILHFPLAQTERAGLNAQLNRLEELNSVRALFGGPLAQALLDFPFSLVFIGIIFAMGGPLGFIPLVTLVIFAIATWLSQNTTYKKVRRSGRLSNERRDLLMEALEKMPTLRACGAEGIWHERYQKLSEKASLAGFQAGQASQNMSSFAAALNGLTALAVIGLGIHLILQDALTAGGLIATMMLIWKILAPAQSLYISGQRLGQSLNAIRQLNQLMKMPVEKNDGEAIRAGQHIQGEVFFDRVTFRYGSYDPELTGVTFRLKPGESVGIIGLNGAGKSTILKLVAGLYYAQSGSVKIDGRDIRQFSPVELRQFISYVPQNPQLLNGSIAENLRLARPEADEHALWQALEEAGAKEGVQALPDGLETLIDIRNPSQLAASLVSRLSLARAYVKQAPIVLLDEPITGLDFEGEFIFTETLKKLKRKATVFIVTHRPGHLKIVDKALLIEKGNVRYFGAAERIIDRLPKGAM